MARTRRGPVRLGQCRRTGGAGLARGCREGGGGWRWACTTRRSDWCMRKSATVTPWHYRHGRLSPLHPGQAPPSEETTHSPCGAGAPATAANILSETVHQGTAVTRHSGGLAHTARGGGLCPPLFRRLAGPRWFRLGPLPGGSSPGAAGDLRARNRRGKQALVQPACFPCLV